MIEETTDIIFGGKPHKVTALEFDALQEIAPLIQQVGLQARDMKTSLGYAKQALCLALKIDAEEFGKIKTDVDEIFAAIDSLSEVSGLKRLGERMAARAKAAATAPLAG